MSAQSSVSREHLGVAVSGKSEEVAAALSAERQQMSMSGESQISHCDTSFDEQIRSRSGMKRPASRRAEAMAALEGRQHAMSPG